MNLSLQFLIRSLWFIFILFIDAWHRTYVLMMNGREDVLVSSTVFVGKGQW